MTTPVVDVDIDNVSADNDAAQQVQEISQPSVADDTAQPPALVKELGLVANIPFLVCYFNNKTPFVLDPRNSQLLYSTRYDINPRTIPAHRDTISFIATNDKPDTTGTLSTFGGTHFRLGVDVMQSMDISLGWNLSITSTGRTLMKAGVTESSKPIEGYDAATVSGNSIRSQEVFRSGHRAGQFKIQVSAAPFGENFISVVVEEDFL